ncbi:MAG: RNA-binding transcriptional accessory protein [Bacteroides sp.]|nr:RNA-binding transcriptional accessory protein [Bacteroides sp.]MCM1389742.1 RNA-binding transcriptional accessory protein [Bacteroides sp.]
MSDFSKIIAGELGLDHKSVSNTLKLLDDGATIPFISRYRKEATGGLDEVKVHDIKLRYDSLVNIEKRKETILSTIGQLGKLTPELEKRIAETFDSAQLEDIYMPFRPKRRTRAKVAVDRGLEPLAKIIMAQNISDPADAAARFVKGEIADEGAALAGAADIIAEWVSESERARAAVRARYNRTAVFSSRVVAGKETDGAKYENYFSYSSPLRSISSHRLLAVMRGASEGFLKMSLSVDDDEVIDKLVSMFVKPSAHRKVAEFIRNAVKDGYRRLLRSSIETELLAAAKEKADDVAIAMFADNVRQLLLAPPLGHKRVLAVDPGFRTGCKLVCLDSNGDLLHTEVIYPNPPKNDRRGAAAKVSRLVEVYRIEAIAIGSGTASRETENFFSSIRYPREVKIFIVNENGASVYSASKIAREEFPDYDVTVRGAVSIGRRLIDPLAELVKIEPKSIGVGQYQHDVDQAKLKEALDYTVESCVNSVGVDLNTASKELLAHVSGIGPALAASIVNYRSEHGDFRSRRHLLDVPRLGEKAFQQAAGFLRIPGGDNILDNTAVHPERYGLIEKIAADHKCVVNDFIADPKRFAAIDFSPYINETVGLPTFKDIISELEKPGRDPRKSVGVLEFDERVKTIDDLQEGMVLNGIVNNVTAFGCFVDIGLHEHGLVHISQLADRYVANPAEVVKLHQHVKVKVMEVDRVRGRISLSMKGVEQ